MSTETQKRTPADVDAAVLAHIANDASANGGTSAVGIRVVGAAIDVAPGTVQQSMRRLEKAGKLEHAGKNGRKNVWRIAAA
jgi:hypothetical protein